MVYKFQLRAVVAQGLLVLSVCALIELGAGHILRGMEHHLELLPGLLVMVPPLLALRGNINGALASRLGSALHSGVIQPRLIWGAELRINLASSLILSVIASTTIGILSFVACILTGVETIGVLDLVLIAVIAGFTSALLLAAITIFVSIRAYVIGLDPDNITSPTMTTLGDFVTLACILLAVILVA